ncbi:MAG: exopolyphosphatase [Lachnospiraceae bacterium]|nr:exopolyphosphatase [Lachnospiraceae bacterium]
MAVYLFAAIDVGSYDLEMTIYQIADKGNIKTIDRLRQSVAAGHDTYRSGRISYAHINEICKVLSHFSEVMRSYHINTYRAYGTSALREAENREIVLDQIKVKTGIEVTVPSNAEQRFLCYKAIAVKEKEFEDIIQKGTAIADVGSGSTQLSLFDKDALVATQYLKVGSLRVQDILAVVGADQQNRKELVEELVDADIQTFKRLYLKDRKIENLILTGMSAQYLGKKAGKQKKDRLTAAEFNEVYEKVLSLTAYELSREMDISIEHAYLMLPSVMIYKKILDVTGAQFMWMPGVTLSDGIVAEYAMEKKLIRFEHDFTEDILYSARNIAKRYKSNQKHAQSLETLALAIFDSTRKIHGLGKRERLLLQIAAILHDCGKFVSMTDPADCGYYIIMSTEIIGLSRTEQKLIANIVKYYPQNFDYEVLKEEVVEKRNIIAKLTAILKIAGILDRSHRQKINTIRCTIKDNQLILVTDAVMDITLEQNLVSSRADFFEEVYGIRPVLRRRRMSQGKQ